MREILDRLAPRTRTVRLVSGELDAQIQETKRQLVRAQAQDDGSLKSPVAGLERRLEELEAAADATGVTFVFRAIPRIELDELKRRYPPTEEQWDQYREMAKLAPFTAVAPSFDLNAAAAELIAAASSEPNLSDDDARVLWDGLSEGQAAELLRAAWEVQQEASTRPFSQTDTAETSTSGGESTTPVSTESLSAPTKDD